jgi:hypothetical protein
VLDACDVVNNVTSFSKPSPLAVYGTEALDAERNPLPARTALFSRNRVRCFRQNSVSVFEILGEIATARRAGQRSVKLLIRPRNRAQFACAALHILSGR